jgi:hypothetical protein
MKKDISSLKTVKSCERFYTLSPAIFGKGNVLSELSIYTSEFDK